MINYLVFDIETRVDKELVKEIYDPENSLTLDQAYDAATFGLTPCLVQGGVPAQPAQGPSHRP